MNTHTDEFELANPLRTGEMAWIPTGDGKFFRPLRFGSGGWSELMRLEPGAVVGWHRHTGPVHASTLTGSRTILTTGEPVGPGDYVYEPPGNVDTWQATGDQPCIVHINVVGAVEYLDPEGDVVGRADSASQRGIYLAWCREHDAEPEAQLAEPADPSADRT
jgi:hypothetical protein